MAKNKNCLNYFSDCTVSFRHKHVSHHFHRGSLSHVTDAVQTVPGPSYPLEPEKEEQN